MFQSNKIKIREKILIYLILSVFYLIFPKRYKTLLPRQVAAPTCRWHRHQELSAQEWICYNKLTYVLGKNLNNLTDIQGRWMSSWFHFVSRFNKCRNIFWLFGPETRFLFHIVPVNGNDICNCFIAILKYDEVISYGFFYNRGSHGIHCNN